MTVTSHELYRAQTDDLARPLNFYPAKVTVRHTQLRRLFSVPAGDRVYYVNDYDVYVLDLATSRTTLLATIPFEARCLAADYGWVCVGGEQNGDCAFIRLEPEDGTLKCFGHDLNVDVLGGEIVNSMNIQIMSNDGHSEPEPVVLISNNDRSIKIFSLAQREVLTTLEHDAPVNYATFSPDCSIMAAVGDSDKVYFYKRRRINTGVSSKRFAEWDWRPMVVPRIPTGDTVRDDWGFAVTFSPSGHLCAASSQGGAITVFEMSHLLRLEGEPEDAIICSFRSSRPTQLGCVRSMSFSPAPWDLLAWAEDHGAVGIADVRQMCVRRQVIRLDKSQARAINVEDTTPPAYKDLPVKERLKQQHLARLRSMRGLALSDGLRSHALLENMQSEVNARRQHRQAVRSYDSGLDLDAREQSVLNALETTMDDVEHHTRPYSLHYSSSPRLRPSSVADTPRGYDVQLLNPGARLGPRVHQPRRRTSVVLSESTANRRLAPVDSPRARLSASPNRMTDDEDMPTMSTNDLTPMRGSNSQPLPYNIPTSDPWHVIQSALETAREADRNPSADEQPATVTQIEAALDAERRLGDQLERQLSDERQLSSLLRQQLETQDRLLQSQQHELQAAAEANARHETSLERLLQRELESEQQFGEQRSEELEREIRLGFNRARRLEAERARLLTSTESSQSGSNDTTSASTLLNTPSSTSTYTSMNASTHTSARSSTLPTTLNTRPSTPPTPISTATSTTHPQPSLSTSLARHEAFRRQRLAHIENLERQVRRAESRVASASSDIQALETAIQGGASSERFARQSEARARAAMQAAVDSREQRQVSGVVSAREAQSRANALMRRAEREHEAGTNTNANSASNPARFGAAGTATRTSRAANELTNRVSEHDMRLAQMMFMSTGRARNVDANGNWVPRPGLEMLVAQGTSALGRGGTQALADVVGEFGIGTAGIGWSGDGRRLYVSFSLRLQLWYVC